MTSVVPMRGLAAPALPSAGYSPRELALIRRTVAADTSPDEFDLFMSYAQGLRLDPRRRQIYCVVYNKDKPAKRKMSIIVGIDGFRTIADRTGAYRPDEDEPRYEADEALKGPLNPAGLVKATVSAFKFSHGGWHRVTASAHWDEYAPVKTWDGVKSLEGKWQTMPRLMLAKVAEALALRKAWPDDFSAVYAPEEMEHAAVLDLTPSQAAEAGEVESRLEKIGGANGILMTWADPLAPLESVPVGQLADRALDFIAAHKDEPSVLMQWAERNRMGLQEFWARAKGDALAVRQALDAAVAE